MEAFAQRQIPFRPSKERLAEKALAGNKRIFNLNLPPKTMETELLKICPKLTHGDSSVCSAKSPFVGCAWLS